MLNSFPQGSNDPDVLVSTIERATANLSSRAIAETAKRFICGDVEGQSRTFAPSVPEFVQEARRMETLVPYMDRPRLPAPAAQHDRYRDPPPLERVRMGFKLSVLSAGLALGKADDVARANDKGLDELMALGQLWGVPIPEELWPAKAA